MGIADKVLPTNPNLKFAANYEPWTVYELENGCTLRVRPTLISVKDRGLHDEKHPLGGYPSFGLNVQVQQVMDWSDEVQRIAAEFRRKHGLPEMPGEGGF